MKYSFKRFKDRLFNFLVVKNPKVLNEYMNYREKNEDIHANFRMLTWIYIAYLNINYRVLKRSSLPVNQGKIYNRKNNSTKLRRNGFNGNRPVLHGPESNVFNRPAPQHFVKQLLEYDIISFDIFDTLILRPFSKPQDLFLFLENKFDYINLANLREKIEQEVRGKVEEKTGGYSREVTIEQIYEELSKWTGINKEEGIKAEFELELEFCFANPYMKIVFDILKANNKKIIAVSDMYLPKPMMEKLLKKCGYDGFEEIFVSCDYGYNKRSKGLYNAVDRALTHGKRVVHIGDNYVSDIEKAREFGWDAIHYKNVHHIGNKHRANNMSRLIGSAYSGIVNTHLHNGTVKTYDPYYEFGFIYGGLFILGFCSYIHRYAVANNIDKVLFLSRDGYIMKQVYDKLFSDIPSEYILWSRNPSRMLASGKYRYDYLNQYIELKAKVVYSIEDILNAMDLDFMIEKLNSVNLDKDELLTKENKNDLYKLILEHWDEIQEYYSISAEAAKMYLQPIIGGCKKVAVIDIGWHGTSIMGIRAVINEVLKMDCEVHGIMAAACSRDPDHITTLLMANKINTYLFSPLENRNMLFSHRSRGENNVLMELFCTAPHPSLLGFKKNEHGELEFEFEMPEVENYEIIKNVQQGILDFVEKYQKTFGNYDYMFNISGLDAYQPIKHILTDLTYIKKFFGNYSYNRLLGNQKRSQMTTINDILKNVN